MASACVNNVGIQPENFLDGSRTAYTSYGWLSPRASFSREYPDDSSANLSGFKLSPSAIADTPQTSKPAISGTDLEGTSSDFEFRLEDPVTLIPADELFFDGKLMPLQISSVKSSVKKLSSTEIGSRSPDTMTPRRVTEIDGADPYSFSPRAPRCSSRWRELLGLKKATQMTNTSAKNENPKTELSSSSNRMKSLKQFLHRNSKLVSSESTDALYHPLLKDLDYESVFLSSARLSLSSSSSGHSHEDLPRLSLDFDKPSKFNQEHKNRINLVKTRVSQSEAKRIGRSPVRRTPGESGRVKSREVSMDSPRMISSGKIVFQSLERSSSSPSSFNGGPRLKHNGIERSYSANVRVPPVLNVPVSSLRGSSKSSGSMFGFSQLFSSPQKKTEVTCGGGKGQTRQHCRNRITRT
ncbi:uncharacterized protein LOC111480353 [Cucurbita maxima]|uniref:Uncharacterized protein LOC111480353 n=1 Tax=Cucurbita maxima TaxID=3661 RepID=A0A6J1J120_CUCMA|nr:uncharacterized protein LOC111480353 [Cucurbita maxima]